MLSEIPLVEGPLQKKSGQGFTENELTKSHRLHFRYSSGLSELPWRARCFLKAAGVPGRTLVPQCWHWKEQDQGPTEQKSEYPILTGTDNNSTCTTTDNTGTGTVGICTSPDGICNCSDSIDTCTSSACTFTDRTDTVTVGTGTITDGVCNLTESADTGIESTGTSTDGINIWTDSTDTGIASTGIHTDGIYTWTAITGTSTDGTYFTGPTKGTVIDADGPSTSTASTNWYLTSSYCHQNIICEISHHTRVAENGIQRKNTAVVMIPSELTKLNKGIIYLNFCFETYGVWRKLLSEAVVCRPS